MNIIDIKNYTDALRNTGYKSVENAVAEIVDNSIEADASNILILFKKTQYVEEVAILDNGHGMNKDTLHKCLGIGMSTRRARKGMGRFGVGLPQASLHVCPRVEVYSWTSPEDVWKTYLDIKEIKSGAQEGIKIEKVNIPREYLEYIQNPQNIQNQEMNFKQSGTLVIWKNCDNLVPKRLEELTSRFLLKLGRKFRYFLTKDKNAQKKLNIARQSCIGISVLGTNAHNKLIKPNDPLYLMTDNQILGDPKEPTLIKENGEAIFELYNADSVSQKFSIEHNGKTKIINIIFSIAKKEYHDAGGTMPIGKHLKKNVGISILRAGREIDFNKFGFFSEVNQPQHRWWGAEISFDPDLDEYFRVANNKQSIILGTEEGEENNENSSGDSGDSVDKKLKKIVEGTIKEMYKALEAKKKGTRKSKKTNSIGSEEQLVTQCEKDNKTSTSSQNIKNTTSEEELQKIIEKKFHDNGDPDPSNEKISNTFNQKVNITQQAQGQHAPFIDVSFKTGTAWLTINTDTTFFNDFYSKIEGMENQVPIKALHLILMAFARAEDEAYDSELAKYYAEIRVQWSEKIRKYLNEDYQA